MLLSLFGVQRTRSRVGSDFVYRYLGLEMGVSVGRFFAGWVGCRVSAGSRTSYELLLNNIYAGGCPFFNVGTTCTDVELYANPVPLDGRLRTLFRRILP